MLVVRVAMFFSEMIAQRLVCRVDATTLRSPRTAKRTISVRNGLVRVEVCFVVEALATFLHATIVHAVDVLGALMSDELLLRLERVRAPVDWTTNA